MTPIQQLMLGAGGAIKKTYMEDIFSNYLWKGNNQDRTITNNIDLKKEGGMVWVKRRTADHSSILADTERDDPSLTGQKYISTDTNSAQSSDTNGIKYFYNTGFSTGSGGHVNSSSHSYSSYSFRRASGFFDVIKYTGNGSNGRQISHNLGSVPGCIWVKRIDAGADWQVYHRGNADTSNAGNYWLSLNQNYSKGNSDRFYDLEPTSTYFTVSDHESINTNSYEYIAYLFAGGASTAATAKSIELDGSNDYFQTSTSTDFEFSGDFTFECWFNPQTITGNRGIFTLGQSNLEGGFELYASNKTLKVDDEGSTKSFGGNYLDRNQWYHIAFVRSGTKNTLYLNGTDIGNYTSSHTYGINSGGNRSTIMMGTGYNGAVEHYFDGNISNVRVLNGTALYTSSFRPPTEPLTNITNTKLLCCNNSSVTGSTVAPTTLTASGTVASTKHPFDDPKGFVFGDNKDQNVIKCGSYVGNGSSTGPIINLGWEPQWVLIKRTDANEDWTLYDSMRGIITGGDDIQFKINRDYDDITGTNRISLIANGFKIVSNDGDINQSGGNYVYTCIRRSDGYVGKPAEAGTDVFAMDTGSSSSTIPTFDSNFVVDYALRKATASGAEWASINRLTGEKYLVPSGTAAEGSYGYFKWDSNVGFGTNFSSGVQAWMWKRSNSFTTLAYQGNGVAGRQIAHDMNKTVEMLGLKHRSSSSYNWMCYHKGLNGGTSPEDYYLRLNTNDVEGSSTYLNSTAPTSTHITLGSNNAINANGDDYIAMLFASVDGISKVGSYTGNGSSNGPVITTNFAPRFVLIKCTSHSSTNWKVFDTIRGIDKDLSLNSDDAQADDTDWMDLSSTGFQLADGDGESNGNNKTYIYYANA